MKILLVRLRLIGDVVFTTPVIRAVRRRYPDAHMTYLVEPAAAPVVLRNPHVNEVMVIPRRSGLRRLRDDLAAAARLRRRRFDVVIDLHGGPRGAWLTWATGAPRRIGYSMRGRTWMYTDAVPRPADNAPRHSVENQWDLLAPLGVERPEPARDAVEMPDDADADARVGRLLQGAGIAPSHRVVVLHVSAGNPFRRWPPDSFASLMSRLAGSDPSLRFVLTSGPSDALAAREVAQRVNGARPAGVAIAVHVDVDLAELRALIARAALYIGGDSGPLHVAATTRTPIVALFGSTLPDRSMPWRSGRWFAEAVEAGPLPCRPCRQRACAPGDFRCLTRIAPEDVAAAAMRALRTLRHAESPSRSVDPHAEARGSHTSWSAAHA